MNSSTAKKAMRLAAMLATRPTEAAAPLLAASRMFCSSLHGKRPQWTHLAGHPPCQVSAHSMDVCTQQALPALGHPQCPLVPQSAPMASLHWKDTCSPTPLPLSSHSPTGEADACFALELGLLHFRVDEFGHGEGTGRSHHRSCDQGCCIDLQHADQGLRHLCTRLRPVTCHPRASQHVSEGIPAHGWHQPVTLRAVQDSPLAQGGKIGWFSQLSSHAHGAACLDGGIAGASVIVALVMLISPAV